MDEVEEKRPPVQQIDPLYFVVRELDSIKITMKEEFNKVYKEFNSIRASTREEFEKVYKEFEKVYKEFDKVYRELDILKAEFGKVYERFNRIEDEIRGLRSFTVKLVFGMATLIIAGVGILFQLMR